MWAVVIAWAVTSHLCLFLLCVRFFHPDYFFSEPPGGIDRYVFFSTNRYVGEIGHAVFFPYVHVLATRRLYLYAPDAMPEFYEVAPEFFEGVNFPNTGWQRMLRWGRRDAGYAWFGYGLLGTWLALSGLIGYLLVGPLIRRDGTPRREGAGAGSPDT